MQGRTTPEPHGLDDETLAFVGRVFQYARGGQAQELDELLGMGLPANLRNEKGDSLLMLASYYGHAAVVRLLLERGAAPDQANDLGQTPLAGAAFKGDGAVVALLLDHGARVDAGGEQRFVGIDVPHASNKGLVQQQRLDVAAAAMKPFEKLRESDCQRIRAYSR